MRKIILIMSTVLGLYSCSSSNELESNKDIPKLIRTETNTKRTGTFSRYEIYEFEDCEYIIIGPGRPGRVGAHKGNCKNPIHYI